jgi:hypothetical protein
MDGHRHTDAVTDSALERDLEAMLAVEPSPEFLARVRTRVAAEPATSAWRFQWTFAAVVAASVLIVAVGVWRSLSPAGSFEQSAQAPVVAEQATPAVRAIEPDAAPTRAIRPRVARVIARPERRDVQLPAVIVAENETRAFAMLMTNIRRARYELSLPTVSERKDPLAVDEMPKLAPVTVDLIEIRPIADSVPLE